jgi:DNA (cytosine-5)-methyltransferase 1
MARAVRSAGVRDQLQPQDGLYSVVVRDGETGLRLLTANECKAIMGFPNTFKIPVSRTQMYRQMGNSVAVPVITKLADWISKEL